MKIQCYNIQKNENTEYTSFKIIVVKLNVKVRKEVKDEIRNT